MVRYLIMIENVKNREECRIVIMAIIEGFYCKKINKNECNYLLTKCANKFDKEIVDSSIYNYNKLTLDKNKKDFFEDNSL